MRFLSVLRSFVYSSFKYLENSSACFFSLLRDIFVDLPDVTADLQQVCIVSA